MGCFNFFLWISFILSCVSSAGISVHFWIANQVADGNQFTDPNYYVGSFFPDAFYNCFGHSQTAEDAHWPPFTRTAVNYYRDEYILKGIPNDNLRNFIFGLFSHQVVDVPWHSLNSYQGLIRMIAEMDFDGDYGSAHSFVDTAGDFILLNSQFQNLSPEKADSLLKFYSIKWEYPIDDIMMILKLSGSEKIIKTELEVCLNRGIIALKSELGAVLTNRKTRAKHNISLEKSPLLSDSLLSYYFGGINQIVNTLQICRGELTDWFAGIQSKDPWDICRPVFKKHSTEIDIKENQPDFVTELQVSPFDNGAKYISPMVRGSQFGYSLSFGDYLDEPTLAVGSPFEDILGSIYMIPINEIIGFSSMRRNKDLKSIKISADIRPNLTYPVRFGSKLINWKVGDTNFLVASEPGISSFKVFFGNKLVATLNSFSSDNTLGTKGNKQFDIIYNEPVDYDKDGSSDLIIGSPYSDLLSFPQSGKFFIIKGSLVKDAISKHFQTELDEPLNLNIEDFVSHQFNLPLEFFQSNGYDHFASSVAFTEDCILVSVGSVGSIAVFHRITSKFVGLLSENGLEQGSNFVRVSSSESKLFGHNFVLSGRSGNDEWVAISKSADSSGNCNLCGSVVLFRVQNRTFEKVKDIKPRDTNNILVHSKHDYIFGRFGSNAIKINEKAIIVSSPGFRDGAGALFLLNIDEILNKGSVTDEPACQLIHIGDEGIGFSNFGASLEIFTHNNKIFLAIGMPEYGIGLANDFAASLSGYVKLVELGSS